MYKNLEEYLTEIRHHLSVKQGADEILTEIESHILEKTEQSYGEITADSLQKTIADYGNPRHVAEKYMEGEQLISPVYKKYLLAYTGILFAFHFVLILFAMIFKRSMVAFPFIYIPKPDSFWFILNIPTALIFDLGLVGLFFYFFTHKSFRFRLPWPKISKSPQPEKPDNPPKAITLILMLLGFALVLFTFIKYKTLFFASLNFPNPESLFNPTASIFYSWVLLNIFANEIIFYIVRFFTDGPWIRVLKNTVHLILFWLLWNSSVEVQATQVTGFDLYPFLVGLLVFLTVCVGLSFISSLVQMGKWLAHKARDL